MRVSVLGPLRVEAGQSVVPVGGRQLRLLLILLALEAGRVVPAAVLAARLWPEEEPADPGNALQTLVSRPRAALRPAGLDTLIESHSSGYRLAVAADAVDALAFESMAAAGRQAQALTVFAEGRELLADRLGVDPSPVLEQPYLRILRGISERPVVPAPAILTPPVVTPPPTSFVGRDEDVTLLLKLLRNGRLVTLTGPGGVGKTRLAIELPRRLEARAWFVELAPVTDPAEVVFAVLNTLGIRGPVIGRSPGESGAAADPAGRLTGALAERCDVLILDNCEHVIGATAALSARILAACPGMRIVATSREPLRIDGESLCPVSPLPVPPAAQGTAPAPGTELAELSPAAYASVRLLCDRAAAVRPGFSLDAGNAHALARICRTLDGMPLAIELAAVWLRVLSPAQLAERLADRFALLTGGSRTALPRHQTLRAVVDWSWEALSEPERILARRLSVFPAGATLAAVEQVCAGDGLPAAGVLTALSGAVDKSILAVVEGERYLMLETVRAYCLERLAQASETRQVRDAFASYYLNLAEIADPLLRTAAQRDSMRELAAEQDNLHAALRWTISQRNAELGLRFARALGWYWMLRGQPGESEALSREVLELGPGGDTLAAAEGRVVCTLIAAGPSWNIDNLVPELSAAVDELSLRSGGNMASVHPIATMGIPLLAPADREPARALRLFDVYATSDDPWVRAAAPFFRGVFGAFLGDTAKAEAAIRQAVAAYRAIGDSWGIAVALIQLAEFAGMRADYDTAIAALTESESLATCLGAWGDISQVGGKLALIHVRTGDFAAARADLTRAVRSSTEQGTGKTVSAVRLRMVEVDLCWCEGDLAAAEASCGDVLTLLAARESDWWNGILSQAMARLALIRLAGGEQDRCRELLADALRTAASWVERPPVANVIDAIAALVQPDGPDRAASLLGAAHTVRGVFDESSLDAPAVRGAARRALGDAAFDAAYEQGRELSYDAAVTLAAESVAQVFLR